MTKPIAIVGTLDTKGREVSYLRDLVVARGHRALIIDPGVLGTPAVPADVSREEVARAGGAELADLIAAGDKGTAMRTMIDGTRAIVVRLHAEGRLGGVLAVGGGQGTAIGTAAMQALPLGVPKVMVSTMASGRNIFEPYVGTSDVTLMHAVADIAGLNTVTRRVFGNAAAAVTAMAEAAEALDAAELGRADGRPVLGATMLGLTTPCVLHAQELLEGWGYELIAFHPNGTGGRCLERLVDEGLIRGVLDVSTQELTGHVCHGLFDAGPGRLRAAGRMGIPQVVAPGGTDYIVLGPLASLPEELRRRPHVVHNPQITLVRTAPPEMAAVGRLMAARLNDSRGPVTVLVPLGGFSAADRPGQPFYDPVANAALVQALDENLAPHVRLEPVDAHVNDPAFARTAAERLHGMMDG